MTNVAALLTRFDPRTGLVDGVPASSKRLSDLRGIFADKAAYESALRTGDRVVYTVSTLTPDEGEGALHYGVGVLFPGSIGDEYHLTRGHVHSWRAAAELYIGLSGEGKMLLEDETSGENSVVDLGPNSAVYVPGHTAHRTVNVGTEPLVYIGIYPARAGHDYGEIAKRNFKSVIVRGHRGPVALSREDFLLTLPRSGMDRTSEKHR